MNVDIVCVGFGPAMGGFLTTLSRAIMYEDGTPALKSYIMPDMPLQVVCYERADNISFGISGLVTKAQGIKESFSHFDLSQIPLFTCVNQEKLVYLLDPVGASHRRLGLRLYEAIFNTIRPLFPIQPLTEKFAVELPCIPAFLCKKDGLMFPIGQFMQWVGDQIMAKSTIQIWPASPVVAPLIEDDRVIGVRLVDQGTNKRGYPDIGFTPGMNIYAPLTVVGDGSVGAIGQALNHRFGLPVGNYQREWAIGMKFIIDMPEDVNLAPGTIIHTLGYPEPEIFGFLYIYPEKIASLGIFIPSWFDSPIRTVYRYLQHWMLHPYIWKWIKGGHLRSWGAKSINESGRRGEPFLVGNGFARIGEGSGSTNVLTGSGVDEAWTTGVDLAYAVIELVKKGHYFTQENLKATYLCRRRKSFVEQGSKIAEHARDGFQKGVIQGFMGMALVGYTKGRYAWFGNFKRPYERIPSLQKYFKGRISLNDIDRIRNECISKGESLHDAFMDRLGWPVIPYDGQLLISHQDALLIGGKVQAPLGYADHVQFLDETICYNCKEKICIEACSGQAITTNPSGGIPFFDREKCVHCGACLWNCSKPGLNLEHTVLLFQAGAGGLHSVEN